MAFFLNNPPPEQDAPQDMTGEAASSSYSDRIKPLFKQDSTLPDALPGQHISLSAYISKHLQEGAPDLPTPVEMPAVPAFQSATRVRTESSGQEGQYLNSLDVEMAAGLEQYLPTPLFRMRVMKKRLDGEITKLKMQLSKYERLPDPSPDMQERIGGMRARLATLEAHEHQVSRELVSALTFGSFLYTVSRWVQGSGGWFSQWAKRVRRALTGLLYGQAYLEMEETGEALRSLQELFADRMNDRAASDMELSQILNQYEQTTQRMEMASLRLKPLSFPRRLWQEAKRLVK